MSRIVDLEGLEIKRILKIFEVNPTELFAAKTHDEVVALAHENGIFDAPDEWTLQAVKAKTITKEEAKAKQGAAQAILDAEEYSRNLLGNPDGLTPRRAPPPHPAGYANSVAGQCQDAASMAQHPTQRSTANEVKLASRSEAVSASRQEGSAPRQQVAPTPLPATLVSSAGYEPLLDEEENAIHAEDNQGGKHGVAGSRDGDGGDGDDDDANGKKASSSLQALITFASPPVIVELHTAGQHSLEWKNDLCADGVTIKAGTLNLYTYPGAFAGKQLALIRKVLLELVSILPRFYDVPDAVGAYVIHALIVCNTEASLEVSFAILDLAPRLLLLTHYGQPFLGEGSLHIVCANRREELACKV